MRRDDDDLDLEGSVVKMDKRLLIPVVIGAVIILIVTGTFFVLNLKGKNKDESKDPAHTAGAESTEKEEMAGGITENENTLAPSEKTEATGGKDGPKEQNHQSSDMTQSADQSVLIASETETGNSAKPSPDAGADTGLNTEFVDVNETVTAKEKVNLRDIPSQDGNSSVIAELSNGGTAQRTGIGDSGWSRLEYNGTVCYAVSSYLTTDLSYQTSSGEGFGSGDGIRTKFAAASDMVTAKIEVNLRALPSVTNPDAAVIAVLHNGETVARTGINEDYGWSRVDYNGQTLYCISSYLTAAQ